MSSANFNNILRKPANKIRISTTVNCILVGSCGLMVGEAK